MIALGVRFGTSIAFGLAAALVTVVISSALIGRGGSSGGADTTRAALAGSFEFVEGGPTEIDIATPYAVRAAGGRVLAGFEAGKKATAETGCLACHKVGMSGNRGPGRNLTHIGSILSPARIEAALIRADAPMPSFRHLPRTKRRDISLFLSLLRR